MTFWYTKYGLSTNEARAEVFVLRNNIIMALLPMYELMSTLHSYKVVISPNVYKRRGIYVEDKTTTDDCYGLHLHEYNL